MQKYTGCPIGGMYFPQEKEIKVLEQTIVFFTLYILCRNKSIKLPLFNPFYRSTEVNNRKPNKCLPKLLSIKL